MTRQWLLNNADYPIRYSLTRDKSLIDPMLKNIEVVSWLRRLTDRALRGDISDIHGSHDYRLENIIGKCFILGLDANVRQFDLAMRFYIDFLDKHIANVYDEALTFEKMYQYRDCETLIACYMPFLGYANEKSVRYVAEKRASAIYRFTKQRRYDIYRSERAYPGVKQEWKPHIVDPELYVDGNIALPSIHDLILFAGMYRNFDATTRDKVETTIRWLFGEGYSQINGNLYYYAPDDPRYKAKSINSKVFLYDFDKPNPDPGEERALLFHCFILSHFQEARNSVWFSRALSHLDRFKTEAGRYIFPKTMIAEQCDVGITHGGHMNVGESKMNKTYAEIISTYWMERINANLS